MSNKEAEEGYLQEQQAEMACQNEIIDLTETEGEEDDFVEVPSIIADELPQDFNIKHLMGYFVQHTYTASDNDPRVEYALDTCIHYLERDCAVMKIYNTGGKLSTYYPAVLPFLDSYNTSMFGGIDVTQQELKELVTKAYRARCRQRFPVPVINFQDKFICRSATLAGNAEIFGHMALDVIFSNNNIPESDGSLDEAIAQQLSDNDTGFKIVNELQAADITLLQKFEVKNIVDLMVENRKHKFGVPVTSSEKVLDDDKYRANFNILSLPYPGCEFFKEFHDNNFNPEQLYFDWDQDMCDAELNVPHIPELDALNINWDEHKSWDLVEITSNYLKYIIKYLQHDNHGILIHCISGWDRTPLFISLLRLSMWADGAIHKSLDAHEVLYLTLAYDWLLFGHHLADRLAKHEDILLYCFTFLKYIMGDDFSVMSTKDNKVSSPDETFHAESEHSDSHQSYEFENNDIPAISGAEAQMFLQNLPQEIPEFDFDSPPLSPILCEHFPMEVASGSEATLCLPGPSFYTPTFFKPSKDLFGPDSVNHPMCSSPIPHHEKSSPSGGGDDSSGGWQVVSETGSVRGSEGEVAASADGGGVQLSSRQTRLAEVRRLFYRCYYQTVTEKHVNYQSNTNLIKSILGNLADITGIHKPEDN